MVKKDFEIHGGGTGLVVMSAFTALFWLGFIFDFAQIVTEEFDLKKTVTLVGFTLVCLYFSVFVFRFWKSNFIKIESVALIISVMDRERLRRKRQIWPRFNKQSIRLEDIETVSLNKPASLFLAPALMIKRRNNKPYYVDTKPFSKSAFWKLFKELEKRGIKVQVTVGAI